MHRVAFRLCLVALILCPACVDQACSNPLDVKRVSFYAQSVAREIALNIVLPAGYEQGNKRYPVLYLLHGRGSNLDSWVDMGIPEFAAKYELIVVMPDAGASWYVNWVESGGGEKNDWDDYIAVDLIGYVDSHYRTFARREGRAIDGASMGGYGALAIGLKHPDLFCSINSHSGGLRFIDRIRDYLNGRGEDPLIFSAEKIAQLKADAAGTNSLLGQTPSGRMVTTLEECDAIDPFHLVLTVPTEQLPDIRLDCGLHENLIEYSQKFAALLMEHKIPFTFAQAPGRHDEANWSRAVQRSMEHQYNVMMKELNAILSGP